MAKAEIHIGQPVAPRLNIAVNFEFRLLELGLPGNLTSEPWETALIVKSARALLVKRKIANMNCRVDPWWSRVPEPDAEKSARPPTATCAFCSSGIRVRSKSAPVKLKRKAWLVGIVSRVARDGGLVVFQLDIFEPDLPAIEIQSRTETLNRFAIDRAIAQQNMPLPDGSGSRAGHLQLNVHSSRHRICVPRKARIPAKSAFSVSRCA